MKKSAAAFMTRLVVLFCMLGPMVASVSAQTPEATPVAETPGRPSLFTIADLDLTTDPGDDFYQFATGGWIARTTTTPTSPWISAFTDQYPLLTARVTALIEGLEPDPATDTGKVRILYDQVLDVETRNAQGIDPIRPLLAEIAAIDSAAAGLEFHQTAYATWTLFGPFDPWVDPSPTDPGANIGWLYGPWLALEPDWLLDEEASGQETRAAWIEATTQILIEFEFDPAEAERIANGALAWYTALAGSVTSDLYWDPNLTNNPRTVAELEAILPGFDWHAFLASLGWESVERLNVQDIAYLESLAGLLAEADPLALHDAYLAEVIWSGWAWLLTTRIEEIAFGFNGTYLFGVTEPDPLPDRAREWINELLSDALGQAYVDQYFDEETREQALAVVAVIVEQFKLGIAESTWLSEEGKANALARLDSLNINIGYPDTWTSYDGVVVGESLSDTALSGFQHRNATNLALIGAPVEPNYWPTRAVFEPFWWLGQSENAFTVSAAALQPPGFDPEADLAVLYGGFGGNVARFVAGTLHMEEVIYDDDGNRLTWYTEEDFAAYSALQAEVGARISELEPYGYPANGDLQSIAGAWFLGGAEMAYRAFEQALAANPEADQPWFLTPEQRFFVAWANHNRAVLTPELEEFVATQFFWGAPAVVGVEPLRHLQAFHDAFDIEPGDPEYLPPEERIAIWASR